MNINIEKITRIEVINHRDGVGREYVRRPKKGELSIQMQDGGKTMKVFINKCEEDEQEDV